MGTIEGALGEESKISYWLKLAQEGLSEEARMPLDVVVSQLYSAHKMLPEQERYNPANPIRQRIVSILEENKADILADLRMDAYHNCSEISNPWESVDQTLKEMSEMLGYQLSDEDVDNAKDLWDND